METTVTTTAGPTRRILCSSVDFGFGSAGKMLSILEHLGDCRLTVVGSELLASITSTPGDGALGPALEWIEKDDIRVEDFDAALVILDPVLATELTERGLPVVYVDSLPHIWGPADPICTEVFAYCAQATTQGEQRFEALADVHALDWVEPIISVREPGERDEELAVVNVGGVHSPHLVGGTSPYVATVVLPTVHALLAAGRTVRVAGNVGGPVAEALTELGVPSGVMARPDFLTLVGCAGLLVTSPGMTAMLEAGAARTPTILLPPQNLSQILNADCLAGQVSHRRIDWPDQWLSRATVEAARMHGEEAALDVIYAGIERIADRPEASDWVLAQVADRLVDADSWLSDRVAAVGTDGARRVATHVRRAAAA
ncbi:hypothetical protein ACOCJ7_08320 [Knoellia sp. CPCC 206453]|uniref:hypothetical protein n=1 Tax=Knoellia pratensis TaxID=3404796 RepID=UPI0036185501